ncbi:MAG: hypothetical protein WCG99_01205 [Candidatus Berkelbacteria bacterium]
MKKLIYPKTSLKHIECSIIAFNGKFPIKHFDTDDNFLLAWRAGQLQKKKVPTAEAFDAEFANNKDNFYRITKKLRNNIMYNKVGELKAYAFFRRETGLSREEIEKRLGFK